MINNNFYTEVPSENKEAAYFKQSSSFKNELLLCNLCNGYLNIVFNCGICNKLYCQLCKGTNCCKNSFIKNNLVMTELVNNFNFNCVYCNESFPISNYADHKSSCLKRHIICLFCNKTVLIQNETKHLGECLSFYITCQFCYKEYYSYNSYSLHHSKCSNEKVKCETCNDLIQHSLLPTHINSIVCIESLKKKYIMIKQNNQNKKSINQTTNLFNNEIVSNRSHSLKTKKEKENLEMDNMSFLSIVKKTNSKNNEDFMDNENYNETLFTNNNNLDDTALDMFTIGNENCCRKRSNSKNNVTVINLKISGNFKIDYEIIGENNLESITALDMTGVCTEVNGSVKLEFSRIILINCLEILGYLGSKYWIPSHGSHSIIETSIDGILFIEVGILPTIGHQIKKVKFIESQAKYLKLSNKHTGIGLSYITFPSLITIKENNSQFRDFAMGDEYIMSTIDNHKIKLGTNTLSSIESNIDDNTDHGIVTSSPGYIILEMKKASSIFQIEVKGFTSKYLLNSDEIFRDIVYFKHSYDKLNWRIIASGKILSNKVVKFTIPKYFSTKYIKLESVGPIGISFLKLS